MRLEFKACREAQVPMEELERPGSQVPVDRQDQPDPLVRQEALDPQVQAEQPDLRAQLEILEHKELLVQPEIPVQPVRRVHRGQRVPLDHLDRLVRQV